jgi:hypothetical protein
MRIRHGPLALRLVWPGLGVGMVAAERIRDLIEEELMNSRHVLTQFALGASLFLYVACEPPPIEPVLTEAPTTPAARLRFDESGEGIDHQGTQLGGYDSQPDIPTSATINGASGWTLSARDGQLKAERGSGETLETLSGAAFVDVTIFLPVPIGPPHELYITVLPEPHPTSPSVLMYRVKYDGDPVCGGGWVLFVPGTWNSSGVHFVDPQRQTVSLACVEDSAIEKCLRWGYGPYESDPLAVQYHEVCLRAARADYCGNGQSHTFDNTPIDIYDRRDVDPDPRTNPIQTRATNWPLEAVWGGSPGSNSPPRALCLSKLRWQTLPPDKCGYSLPDPRSSANCDNPKAAFCDERTEEEWVALGGILFTRSPFYDKGLYRWRSTTTPYRYLTTTRGFYSNCKDSPQYGQQYSLPPLTGFQAERFEGTVFTDLVFTANRDLMFTLCRHSTSTSPSATCPDGLPPEGYIFRSADRIPAQDRPVIGSALSELNVYQEPLGRYVSTTSHEGLCGEWCPITPPLGIVLQKPKAVIPPPSCSAASCTGSWTCSGRCGGRAPSGCWCDTACTRYGDCCVDYLRVCSPDNSCFGHCGQRAPGGCWCDAACTSYSDCCADHSPICL